MAPNHKALDATIHTLRLTQEAIPARWAEDTADELLTLVQMTFHDLSWLFSRSRCHRGRPLMARHLRHALHSTRVLSPICLRPWRSPIGRTPKASSQGLVRPRPQQR
jgi:hypothetical protein